jgi:hypothetical protein
MAQVLLNNAYPRILVAQWRVPFRNEHFLSSKAAQGFVARRTERTPQQKTRVEHPSAEKRPFVDGHQLTTSTALPA